jgi:hypothetical protein
VNSLLVGVVASAIELAISCTEASDQNCANGCWRIAVRLSLFIDSLLWSLVGPLLVAAPFWLTIGIASVPFCRRNVMAKGCRIVRVASLDQEKYKAYITANAGPSKNTVRVSWCVRANLRIQGAVAPAMQ